jgi:hypothetical protein
MVEAEIWFRDLTTGRGRGPKSWIYPGSQRGKITLRRFEQGRLAASQICFRGFRIDSLW